MKMVCIGSTTAAAIEFGKTVATLLFCIYITQFERIADVRLDDTILYIPQTKLVFTYKLMAGKL